MYNQKATTRWTGKGGCFFRGATVLARPKRQGTAPCCISQCPVIFIQRPVVFPAPCLFQSLSPIIMKTAVKLLKNVVLPQCYNLTSLWAFSTDCLKWYNSEQKKSISGFSACCHGSCFITIQSQCRCQKHAICCDVLLDHHILKSFQTCANMFKQTKVFYTWQFLQHQCIQKKT